MIAAGRTSFAAGAALTAGIGLVPAAMAPATTQFSIGYGTISTDSRSGGWNISGEKPKALFAASLGAMAGGTAEAYGSFLTRANDHGVALAYITGGSIENALRAMDQYRLPIPAVISTDSGLRVYLASHDLSWNPVPHYEGYVGSNGFDAPTGTMIFNAMVEVFGGRVDRVWHGPHGAMFTARVAPGDLAELKNWRDVEILPDRLALTELPRRMGERGLIFSEGDRPIILHSELGNDEFRVLIQPAHVNYLSALRYIAARFGIEGSDDVFFAGSSWRHEPILMIGHYGVLTGAYKMISTTSWMSRPLASKIMFGGSPNRVHTTKAHGFDGVLEGLRLIGTDGGLWKELGSVGARPEEDLPLISRNVQTARTAHPGKWLMVDEETDEVVAYGDSDGGPWTVLPGIAIEEVDAMIIPPEENGVKT